MLFLYIWYKIFSDSLTKLDWGSSFTFAKPCKSRIPKRIDDARSRFSILIFAKFPFLCAQEETQFSVCNFQEICKRISNVWKVPQLQTDEKISFESRARFISLKNPSFDSWYWGSVSFCQLCKYLISLKLWDRILKLKINIQMKRALSLRNSSHFKKQIKTKSIATIKNGGQCNSFLSYRNFFAAILKIRVTAITKSCFWEQTLQWKTNFVAKKQPNKISFTVDLVEKTSSSNPTQAWSMSFCSLKGDTILDWCPQASTLAQ